MPPVVERLGARAGRSLVVRSRRATDRVGLDDTREADLEQIGQFSTSRL
jgi:hypothetical protein